MQLHHHQDRKHSINPKEHSRGGGLHCTPFEQGFVTGSSKPGPFPEYHAMNSHVVF